MKFACPQKPYTHSGFPHLREEQKRGEEKRKSSGQYLLSGLAARKDGEPENKAYSPSCTHSEALAPAAVPR